MIYLTLGLASGFGSDLIIFPNIDIVYNSKRIPNGFPEPWGLLCPPKSGGLFPLRTDYGSVTTSWPGYQAADARTQGGQQQPQAHTMTLGLLASSHPAIVGPPWADAPTAVGVGPALKNSGEGNCSWSQLC